MLQNINRPQSIPLNYPRTVTGGGKVIQIHVSWFCHVQPLPHVYDINIFSDDVLSTIYFQNNIGNTTRFPP